MYKYCLFTFIAMIFTYFVAMSFYLKGVSDGIIQEKYQRLDSKQLKFFLDESDIPREYVTHLKPLEYKL